MTSKQPYNWPIVTALGLITLNSTCRPINDVFKIVISVANDQLCLNYTVFRCNICSSLSSEKSSNNDKCGIAQNKEQDICLSNFSKLYMSAHTIISDKQKLLDNVSVSPAVWWARWAMHLYVFSKPPRPKYGEITTSWCDCWLFASNSINVFTC